MTPEEIKIAEYGAKNGKTKEEVKAAILKYRESIKPKEKTVLEKVAGGLDVAFGGGAIGEAIGSQLAKFTEGGRALKAQEEVGLVPQGTFEETFKGPTGKELGIDLLQAGLAVGTGGLGGVGIKAATPAVKAGVTATKKAAESIIPVASGAKELISRGGQKLANIPETLGTNVGAMKAETEAIKALPTKTAQEVTRSGVDILDVKDLIKIPVIAKPEIKQMADNIAKFARGESEIDPIEFVGKPIVARLKSLEATRVSVGKKLGEVAENLGKVTANEMYKPVLSRLQKTPGLEGLKVDSKGKLDFSNTTLTTRSTASDRSAIQNMFTDAIKSGTGKQKHLLRQELFEVLGGKKRAQVQLTGTQEKAYESIRQGLSDVLETKNSSYKTLSKKYREVLKPLADMRKKIRATPESPEDILDMNAGILARRITSTAMSRGDIESAIKALDKVTKTKSNVWEKTKALQDSYNVLRKYYDIDPKTSFIGLTKSAVEEGGGISGALIGGAKKLVGQTPAVRQAALEKLLNEILR